VGTTKSILKVANVRLLNQILQFYFTFIQENVHPLQGGHFRRKSRHQAPRRPAAGKPARLLTAAGTTRCVTKQKNTLNLSILRKFRWLVWETHT
jgi:hypothetical protein